MNLRVDIGRLLADAREAQGVSQREMARRLNISGVSVWELEHGVANATLERLERVAHGYGIELVVTAREKVAS